MGEVWSMHMPDLIRGKMGTVPQWATSIMMAVVGYLLIINYQDVRSKVNDNENWKHESRLRLQLLEQRYELTDNERRASIRDLKEAQQAVVVELKAVNSALARFLADNRQ